MKNPPLREKHHFTVRTISLAAEEVVLLRRLSQEASGFLGRTTSTSAVIRALIRQIGKQGPSEADALFVEIERELKDGVMWGNKKK